MMSSYSGINGVPSCANSFVIEDVVRGAWGRDDVIVATDCGAISNSLNYQHYSTSHADAAAKALNAGTDLDLGDNFYAPVRHGGNGGLPSALAQNMTTELQVDTALRRVLTPRFRAGLFDPLELQIYTTYPIGLVNSTSHHDFVLEAAEQGIVLLKNERNTLPFDATKSVAVIGPHAASTRDLFESYLGDELCLGGGYACVPTVGQRFTQLNGNDVSTIVVAALDIFGVELYEGSYDEALAAAKEADQVVLAVGLGNEIEYEPHDRTTISLPGDQEALVMDVLRLGKPTVIILINGGAVSVENIEPLAPAMMEAFYPGRRAGDALYRLIYGQSNRFGKLPMTIYKSSFVNEQSMRSFDMTTAPGRTYRYYTNPVTFPFGFGLSYTTFKVDCSTRMEGVDSNMLVTISCAIENVGGRSGDEVLMVYHRVSDEIRVGLDHPAPIKTLVDFARVSLTDYSDQSLSAIIQFSIPMKRLTLTDTNGNKVLYAGNHGLEVSNGHSVSQAFSVEVQSTEVFPSL
jgi:hypothetical protein